MNDLNCAGKNWDGSIQVYIQTSDFMDQFRSSEESQPSDRNWVRLLNNNEVELRMENNELYKVYEFNGGVYHHDADSSDVVSEVVEPIRDIVTVQNKNIWYISYGEKTSGKSAMMGTLPSFSDNEDNIWFYTLVTLFNRIEADREENKKSALKIVAFEIFVDQIIDMSNETNMDSRFDCQPITAQTISEAVNILKTIFSKRNQHIEHLDDSDVEISFSQSHLVIELSIDREEGSGVVSIVDLVGFDSNFTSKIMQGNTDCIPENCTEYEFIMHHNDYSLFSLRNMLLEMGNESHIAFDTHLAQYVYEKITDEQVTISLIGKLHWIRNSFHETLNTMEFCSKFMHNRCEHQPRQSILIENNFTNLEENAEQNWNSVPISSRSEFTSKIQSASGGSSGREETKLDSQNVCKEVQISYLDNNCSSIMGPQNLTNFYGPKTIQIESPPFSNNINGANGKVDIPHLNLGDTAQQPHISESSEIIEDTVTSSQVDSSDQYSLISGESKESLKGSIQCEVEKLMTKFWSKQEVEDIQQENAHPNVSKNKDKDIEVFAERLIENINQKLSQREIRKSSSRISHNVKTNIFEQRASNRHINNVLGEIKMDRNSQTMDNKRMKKYVLKDKVRNLSPITMQNDDNNSSEINNSEMIDDYEVSEEVEFKIENQNITRNTAEEGRISLPSHFKIAGLDSGKEIKIISSLVQEVNDINSEDSQMHVAPSSNSNQEESREESKEEVKFSLHDVDKSNLERKTKDTMNNTDDILELDMIHIQNKIPKPNKPEKELQKGIRLIFRSMKKTQNVMDTLLGIMLGPEGKLDRF